MIFQDVYSDVLVWYQCFVATKKGHLASPWLFIPILSLGFLLSQFGKAHAMLTLATMWEQRSGTVRNVWRQIRELEEETPFLAAA